MGKKRKRKARRTVRRVAKKAPKKVRRVVRRATKDNKITKREVRKISRAGASKKTVKRVTRKANNTRGIKSVGKKRAVQIRRNVNQNQRAKDNRKNRQVDSGGNNNNNRGGGNNNRGGNNSGGGGNNRSGGGKNLGKKLKVLNKKTWEADGKSSYYKKFNYDKTISKIESQEKKRDNLLRKKEPKFKRIGVSDKEKKGIAKSTGFNKLKGRIGSSGKLRDKTQPKAPSYKKFRQIRNKIKSPYASKFQALGKKLEVKYGDKARGKRTRKRLKQLGRKLNPDKAFTDRKPKLGKLTKAGTNILGKYSESVPPPSSTAVDPKPTTKPSTANQGPVGQSNYNPKKWKRRNRRRRGRQMNNNYNPAKWKK